MTAEQAANYTLLNIFGPAEFWDAITQPETSGVPYVSQGLPWDPNAQLLSLPVKPAAGPQMFNISTRLLVGIGDNVGVGGFTITGTAPKKVILRAIGQSLSGAGLNPVLADPILELHGSDGSLITVNDNWRDAAWASELVSLGIAPMDDLESAIIAILLPGQYTAVVRGNNDSSGTAVVEVYDGDLAADSQLANISTRGFVGIGNNVMIGGFIVGDNGRATPRIVVRAIGPSLAAFGISDALENPNLELKNSAGSTLFSNDNWQESQETEIRQTGLAPTDARESALIMELANGNYTAIVRGAGDTTGIALVEVYIVP
jgi:hypothetical protein